MKALARRKDTKTMRDVKVASFEFVVDDSVSGRAKIEAARGQIVQMIELAHKTGRPSKNTKEMPDAA